MDIRVKAAAIVAGITIGTVVGANAIHAAALYLGSETVLKIIGGGILAFLFYQLYTLVLEHLVRQERYKEMSDRVQMSDRG